MIFIVRGVIGTGVIIATWWMTVDGGLHLDKLLDTATSSDRINFPI